MPNGVLRNKIPVLICSLMLAVGGWAVVLDRWSDALTTHAMGGLLAAIGGIVLAWLGESPIRPVSGGGQP